MYGKSASPVLRGAGEQLVYGHNIVAPPGNQAANRENKPCPAALEGPGLLDYALRAALASSGCS